MAWTWEGRRPEERADPVVLDKPANEPGGNLGMHFGQVISAWAEGGNSDVVSNLHSNHPDERGPGGEIWNSIGHHSFLVVFQRRKKTGSTPPPPPATDRLPAFLEELEGLVRKWK